MTTKTDENVYSLCKSFKTQTCHFLDVIIIVILNAMLFF